MRILGAAITLALLSGTIAGLVTGPGWLFPASGAGLVIWVAAMCASFWMAASARYCKIDRALEILADRGIHTDQGELLGFADSSERTIRRFRDRGHEMLLLEEVHALADDPAPFEQWRTS